MIIECPECGTKNSTLEPPKPGRKYRCGQCGAVITFLKAADAQDDTTYVPPTANKLPVAKVETGARAAENTSGQRTLPVVPKGIVEYRGRGRKISRSSRKNQKLIKEWIIHAGLPSTSMKQREKFVNVPADKRETRQGRGILYILLGLFITILVVGLVLFLTQYY
jgi:DNA-directed RNA polymerase subunit RPC12/RpoP